MNIILIVTDQERRFADLPDGFQFDIELPNRKRLIDMGTNFTNAFCASNPCTPNRGVLYTGKHFQETGIKQNWSDIKSGTPTIGNVLSSKGYYCAYKGKWHLSSRLSSDPRGFEVAKSINPDISDQDRPDGKPVNWLKKFGFNDWNKDGDRWGIAQEGHNYDKICADEAVEWLRSNTHKKFMLCVNFIQPHDIMYFDAMGEQQATRIDSPFTAYSDNPFMSEPDTEIYKKKFGLLPKTLHAHDSSENKLPKPAHYYKKITEQIFGKMTTDNEYSRNLDYYLNCLRENDILLGNILDCYDELNYNMNTIIIFTSDHGEMCGEHGLRQKGSLIYKENIGVPLVIAGCGVPCKVTSDAVISTVDIAPTIVGFTGNKHNFVGHDFSRFIKNRKPNKIAPRDETGALFQYMMGIPHHIKPFSQGILTKRFSFSRHYTTQNGEYKIPNSVEELIKDNYVTIYDRYSDPDELHNLADNIEKYYYLIDNLNKKLNHLLETETNKLNAKL